MSHAKLIVRFFFLHEYSRYRLTKKYTLIFLIRYLEFLDIFSWSYQYLDSSFIHVNGLMLSLVMTWRYIFISSLHLGSFNYDDYWWNWYGLIDWLIWSLYFFYWWSKMDDLAWLAGMENFKGLFCCCILAADRFETVESRDRRGSYFLDWMSFYFLCL